MVTNKKQGRNELCACGSEKKFKNCCGKVGAVEKPLTIRNMMECLYMILEGAAEEDIAFHQGPIPFKKSLMSKVPRDLTKHILVAEKDGYLVLTVKQKKPISPIIETVDAITKNLILRP